MVGAGLGFAALFFVVTAAGAGHGTYLPAKILFPYTMLSTALFDEVTVPFSLLALVQFPLYGAIAGSVRAPRPTRSALSAAVVIHGIAALGALIVLRGGSFDP